MRLFTFLPLPDFRVPFFRRRIALSTRFDALLPYLRLPEDFFAAMVILRSGVFGGRVRRTGACCAYGVMCRAVTVTLISDQSEMSRRAGLEAEAINRLTDGVQPPHIRAILVQCLAGELAPSAAIARMLAEKDAPTVRAAIDNVTHRAATISRASDMLVHDRVDELTQIVVETVAAIADARDAGTSTSRPEQASRPRGSVDRDEGRTSGSPPA